MRIWTGEPEYLRSNTLIDRFNLPAAVALACHDHEGRLRATRLADLAANLFDAPDDGQAMEAVLEALSTMDPGARLGAIAGTHVCPNPPRPMGLLQSRHAIKCNVKRSLGSEGSSRLPPRAVLAAVGYSNCFTASSAEMSASVDSSVRWRRRSHIFTSTPVQVPSERAAPVFKRTHRDYRWYRPGTTTTSRTWKPKDLQDPRSPPASLRRPTLTPPRRTDARTGAGDGMVVSGLPLDGDLTPAALPVYCPGCDQRTGVFDGASYFKGEVRSPIRAHTAGLAQSTQLLMTQLHRSMGDTVEDSRTIVLTDSRDDAARTASGTDSTTSGIWFGS